MTAYSNVMNRVLKHSDLVIAMGVLGTLMVMIIPIPASLMDVLFVGSFTLSLAILLVSVYASRPLDFSVFPTVLLFSTLFRLALNVASIRLILLHGHEGTAAAGNVIETFGRMVVGGNYIVGTVVFVILIIINFIVITKGAGRVAEVAARFVLDAMPGKQMAIDADLNAGLIDEEQARERRKTIEAEADFYGSMDGASKFVRGDAIAGILITVINIVGGLTLGVFQQGLEVGRAAEIYTLMTIGDGLVTQIPALVVSTAAGIIVTRAATGSEFAKEVTRQLIFQPRAIGITAVIVGVMGVMPGLPSLPFLVLALFMGSLAYIVKENQKDEKIQKAEKEQQDAHTQATETTVPPEVDALELQVGYGLVNLVEDGSSDLVDRIFQLRKEFAKDLGIVVPKVRIKDNLELQPAQYSVLIRGVPVAGGELMAGYLLAMDPGGADEKLSGIDTTEPVFGLPAKWVTDKQREAAQMAGFTVVDGSTVIATHLSETVRKFAHELVGRQGLQELIDHTARTHPKVVEELIPNVLPLGTVLKVCQNLLREQVPIRDLLTVLETLANYGPQYKDPDSLTEFVRSALARTITDRLTQGTHELEVLTFGPQTEAKLIQAYQRTDQGATLSLEPGYFEKLVTALQATLENTVFNSGSPVLLCHPLVRGQLRKLVERFIPNLNLVSPNEIATFAKVKSLGSVDA